MAEIVSTYTGKKIEITYDRRRCIHAAECGRAKTDLFNVENDPWCDPDAVPVEQAAEIVERCPTGALTYRRLDGGAGEAPAKVNEVHIVPDGPIYAKGEIVLVQASGDERPSEPRVALCRCGKSATKPYCDGAHTKAEFRDSGAVGESPSGAAAEQTGRVTVTEAENGPLVLNGPVALYAASGRLAMTEKKMALCRCGASQNKPFCDGSHVEAGFRSGDGAS